MEVNTRNLAVDLTFLYLLVALKRADLIRREMKPAFTTDAAGELDVLGHTLGVDGAQVRVTSRLSAVLLAVEVSSVSPA